MVYDKIKPLPITKGTSFLIDKFATKKNWSIKFEDGISGNEYGFEWDGQGLDENNIKQVI